MDEHGPSPALCRSRSAPLPEKAPSRTKTRSTGTLFCWGDNSNGQLGTGTALVSSDTPVAVSATGNFVALSAGAYHTCALDNVGAAVCWGADYAGQTGSASEGSIANTAQAVGGGSYSRISVGAFHSCAITAAGATFCWGGSSESGGTSSSSPTAIASGLVMRSITSGDRHTCGIASDGESYCWGSNVFGTLGNELQAAFRTTPQKVALPR